MDFAGHAGTAHAVDRHDLPSLHHSLGPTSPSDILGTIGDAGLNTSPFMRLKLVQETHRRRCATTQEVGSVNAPIGTQTLAPLRRCAIALANLLSDLLFLAVQSDWVRERTARAARDCSV
jgi:hypothetical protein